MLPSPSLNVIVNEFPASSSTNIEVSSDKMSPSLIFITGAFSSSNNFAKVANLCSKSVFTVAFCRTETISFTLSSTLKSLASSISVFFPDSFAAPTIASNSSTKRIASIEFFTSSTLFSNSSFLLLSVTFSTNLLAS